MEEVLIIFGTLVVAALLLVAIAMARAFVAMRRGPPGEGREGNAWDKGSGDADGDGVGRKGSQ